MTSVFVAWAISALVLLSFALLVGHLVQKNFLGILIDGRGRFSLTQFQVVAWTITVLSLISGVFWARLLLDGSDNALDFAIPDELLIVMGISVGSTALATGIKAAKDQSTPETVAASDVRDKPRLTQMFLAEEGAMADQTVDVTKFQNFWITLILLVAYVALAIGEIADADTISMLTGLPGFSGTFVTLLGISHAGYVAGKIPNKPGIPAGLTVNLRSVHAVPAAQPASQVGVPRQYVPRNP